MVKLKKKKNKLQNQKINFCYYLIAFIIFYKNID